MSDMKKIRYPIVNLVFFALISCTDKPIDDPGQVGDDTDTLTANVATFNIRYETEEADAQNNWVNRKARVKKIVTRYAFDVFGINEMRYGQYRDLKSLLPDYAFYAVGRDKGTDREDGGEMVALAYDKAKYTLDDHGFFWLSTTPETPSVGWDAALKRIAVYGKITEKSSGLSFWLFATHFDHQGTTSRYESAKLLINKARELNVDGLPCFLIGDLNPTSPTENTLTELRTYFADAYRSTPAEKRDGPSGTYNAFDLNRDLNGAMRTDYIFMYGDYVINRYRNIVDKIDGYYPSDHTPVMINVSM